MGIPPQPASSMKPQAPPTTRLPLPITRARSVSQLRTQSTSSISKPAYPNLSRKPSIPLRSALGQPSRPQSVINPGPPAPATAVSSVNAKRGLPSRPGLHGVKSSSALRPRKVVTTDVPLVKPAAPDIVGTSSAEGLQPMNQPKPSPGLFTSRSTTASRDVAPYRRPPIDRHIRRVVSRGVVMDAPSPTKTHTPSPTKRSHQVPTLGLRPLSPTKAPIASIADTPLMPHLKGGAGDVDALPLIVDASFSFHDSTSTVPDDGESEGLRAALKASEAALARIKGERDEARFAEHELRKAMKERQWASVKEAVEEELERTREYRRALAGFKAIIIAMESEVGTRDGVA